MFPDHKCKQSCTIKCNKFKSVKILVFLWKKENQQHGMVACGVSRISTLVLVWPALLDNGMFSLRLHSAGHVWIRARFPKTKEWSSDWTKVGMSEQEVPFGFCLRHFHTIAYICSWVRSESWTACLDANKMQQVHSNRVNIKKTKLIV